ncbi:MAG: hypothetical protein EYR95_10560 [Phormidium sp. SL48-SHIP]|nr:MAG: hypothetical protein EYR95_10560 [Phormidium sp. SL48-SHIP]
MAQLSRRGWGVVGLAIALVVFKLGAIAHLPIHASLARHDNLRYIIRATQLLDPHVPYDGLVLARQPGYPAFIAASSLLGLPLRFAQELVYLAAGVFLALSLQRWLQSARATGLFLLLYTLAPFSYHWNRQTLQEVLYLPLTAAILGVCLHLLKDHRQPRRFLLNALILGILLAGFWNTRPEGIWIVPIIALCYGYIALKQSCFASRTRFTTFTAASLLTVAPGVVLTSFLAWTTYLDYGLYHTYDLKAPGLRAAYSSLQRVAPERQRPQITVPAATRAEIYDVSPSFRRLAPHLEIPADDGWRAASCGLGVCDDYAAGIFFWALRDAVDSEGFYQSAPKTEAFYQQIAREVNGACERNWLDCQPQTWVSFVPSLSGNLVIPWLRRSGELGYQLTRSSLVLRLDSGLEDIELRERYYREITREAADFIEARSLPGNQVKDALITAVSQLYQWLFPVLLGLAVLGWLWGGLSASQGLLIGAGILLWCIVVRVLLVAYIDVSSWSVGAGDRYLRPVLPAFWLLMVIGLELGIRRWEKRKPPT